MLRICANHAHHAFAVDHLALVAHLFYRRSNLHNFWGQRPGAGGQFLSQYRALLQQLNDPASRPVVRRTFHAHPISRPQPLKIPDARARRVRNHQILIGQLQPVGGTRKQIDNDCFFTGPWPLAPVFHGLVIL
jgi:hypothetical protein